MSLSPLPQIKVKESRRTRWRAAVLIFVHVLFAIRIAVYNRTGTTPTPLEPSESMQTLELGMVNVGFVFFVLAILSTAVFGRFFCGWGCHVVFMQDLCGHILTKLKIKPKPLRSRLLVFVPIFASLYMFVWPSVIRIWEGRPMPVFVAHFQTEDFWATFPTPAIAILTFVICGFLSVIFLGNKGFCTYACPYGAAFYFSDRFAKGRIRVTDACQGCGHCTAVCTSNVRVHEEVKLHRMVVDSGCMKCMDCVDVCPTNALYFGFGKGRGNLQPRRQYDFTWGEELQLAGAFGFCFYAVRGLYDQIPFLMALGICICFAYLWLSAIRLFTKQQVRLQRLKLKEDAKWTSLGWTYAVFFAAILGLVGHSAIVQFRAKEATRQFSIAQYIYDAHLTARESEADSAARASYGLYKSALDMALYKPAVWEARLGMLQQFLGDDSVAEQHFKKALEMDQGSVPALRNMSRLYERQGRWSEAETLAKSWLKDFPKSPDAQRALGIALYSQQRVDEAAPYLLSAYGANSNDVALVAAVGMVYAQRGELSHAEKVLQKGIAKHPDDSRLSYNLAIVLSQKGENKQALQLLGKIVDASPGFMPAHESRVRIGAIVGDWLTVFRSAEVFRAQGVVQPELVALWSEAAVKAQQGEAASKTLGDSTPDRYFRAALLHRMGRVAEAEALIKKLESERGAPIPRPWR